MAFKPGLFTPKPSAKVAQSAKKPAGKKAPPFGAKPGKCAKCGKTPCKC